MFVPDTVSSHKRTRVTSPEAIRRHLASAKLRRRNKLKEARHNAMEAKTVGRDDAFLECVCAEVPLPDHATYPPLNLAQQNQKPVSGLDSIYEGENKEADPHFTAIEESRRKLAELEADRPLWEEAARERERRESAECAEQAAQKLARERMEASRLAAEAEHEPALRRDARRQERIAASQRNFMRPGPWTAQCALERYHTLSETFDRAKFTNEEPLLFELVPWPVLHAPDALRVEDIDWAAVEAFYHAVRPYLSSPLRGVAEYKTLLQKARQRFHPDRWSARRLTTTIVDENEQDCMTAALNTVSQAIASLWSELQVQ